jgi:glucokinase
LLGKAFFAVDVGGSSVKSGLVVDDQVEGAAREPLAPGLGGLVGQLVRLVHASDAPAWGLCIAGILDLERGRVRHAVNLGLHDVPLLALLAEELPPPRVFVNDLVAATVGEAAGGTLALLQVGTGIAGRCAFDGEVASAPRGHAGEVGHLRFRDEGLPCRCGQRGCAEAYGAWGGILDRFAADGRPEPTPASLLEQARNDEWVATTLREALDAIGFAAAALVAAWDPGTLRVGGGVAAGWGDTLLEAVRAGVDERVLPDLAAATTVEPARLREAAPLLGLASLARSAR